MKPMEAQVDRDKVQPWKQALSVPLLYVISLILEAVCGEGWTSHTLNTDATSGTLFDRNTCSRSRGGPSSPSMTIT